MILFIHICIYSSANPAPPISHCLLVIACVFSVI